jgi:adhesin/invasin
MPATVLRRNLLFRAAIVGALVACSDSATTPTIPPTITAAAVAATDNQSGVAGAPLSHGLQVEVKSDGVPKAGIAVEWETSDGTVIPTVSLTDSGGIATTSWTLGGAPGVMTVSAVVSAALGSPVTFSATALPPPPLVTVTVDSATDGQTGVVGATLTQPLRVTVRSDDTPSAGVAVTWEVSGGSIAPASSITDAAGIATATWTLGHVAGAGQAWVKIPVSVDPVGFFTATALPGPAAVIAKAGGDGQTLAVNRVTFSSLIASVTDQYGNGVQGETVTWTVESGPVAFVAVGGATDGYGLSSSTLRTSDIQGAAVVRAALTGPGVAVDFGLTVGPPVDPLITLDPIGRTSAFISKQNGSRNPAVDTVAVGVLVTWVLDPFDYELHSVVSVGVPSFSGGGNFPYPGPFTISVTFTMPGTYHYADSWYSNHTGIVVVE